MEYNILKEIYKLFYKKNGILEVLEAKRYFSNYEIHQNFKDYIYSIIYKDYKVVVYLLNELKESKEYELARELETVYRLNGGL